MIVLNLNRRQQSFLALGLTVAVIILLYIVLIMPALAQRSAFQEQFDELQFQYARFSGLINQRGQIVADLARLRQTQTNLTGFLEEKPEALAAADLQNHVKTIIESHGGNLISTQAVPHQGNDPFPEVRISIHLRASLDTLRELIYALESGTPTLLLDNLYLQQRNTRLTRRPASAPGAGDAEDLIEARFEVIGYIYQADTEA